MRKLIELWNKFWYYLARFWFRYTSFIQTFRNRKILYSCGEYLGSHKLSAAPTKYNIISCIKNIIFPLSSKPKQSLKEPLKSIILPSRFSKNYFKYSGVKYSRLIAKWKCNRCGYSWISSYTWVSFDAIKRNHSLSKPQSKDERKILKFSPLGWAFTGKNLKKGDYFNQSCEKCLSTSSQIKYYNNLITSGFYPDIVDIPHRSDLCDKCKIGSLCKGYYSLTS